LSRLCFKNPVDSTEESGLGRARIDTPGAVSGLCPLPPGLEIRGEAAVLAFDQIFEVAFERRDSNSVDQLGESRLPGRLAKPGEVSLGLLQRVTNIDD
jgi:hypothetical protein